MSGDDKAFLVDNAGRKSRVLTLGVVLLAIPILTLSHYAVYRWAMASRREALRRSEEVAKLSSAVTQAKAYLAGPEAFRKSFRRLALAGLMGGAVQLEMTVIPMAGKARTPEDVARWRSLLVEARRLEKQLRERQK